MSKEVRCLQCVQRFLSNSGSPNSSRRATHNQDALAFPQKLSSKRPPRSQPPRVANFNLSLKVRQLANTIK